MTKTRIQFDSNGRPGYWCPVCRRPHYLKTQPQHPGSGPSNHTWGFNGDVNSPTFTPSVHTQVKDLSGRDYWTLQKASNAKMGTIRYATREKALAARPSMDWTPIHYQGKTDRMLTICHVHVTKGNIQILGDTPGPLAGKTIPLEEWSREEWENQWR